MGISHKWNGTVLTVTSDSGTSSADLKGAKGDDGARGAQGAQGAIDDAVLDNYAKKLAFNMAKTTKATITFTSTSMALIMMRGIAYEAYGNYLYNGYGTGGANRAKVTTLSNGSNITYQVLDVNADGESKNGFTIFNNSTTTNCRLVILVLYGEEPTVEIEAITV